MLGLFGALNMGARSLQAQSQGIEVAGHNLANVSNPAYSRQRVRIESTAAIPTAVGPQGTGAEATAIIQLRDNLLDRQTEVETSVSGSLESQQHALQYAQAALGQLIDRQSATLEGSTAAQGVGGQHGIAEDLGDLFGAFQSVSGSPSSLAERQLLLMKAQGLATKFNQIDGRLENLGASLNDSIKADVASANQIITEIAKLNDQILSVEKGGAGTANDLRDTRQSKLEELAKLVKIDVSTSSVGSSDVAIGGVTVVSNNQVADQLEAYDDGSGKILVRAKTAGTPLDITSGSIHGEIEARDGAVQDLRDGLNKIASLLITEVNTIHQSGYALDGTTGANFFTGSNASDIDVNKTLLDNPSLVQASGTPGNSGDNQTVLALAQLASKKQATLNGQTLNEGYNQIVASLGQSLSLVDQGVSDQQVVRNMLQQQRDSISGVSLDEEMTDLMKYQRAYQASAKLITTVDEMLETVMNLKR